MMGIFGNKNAKDMQDYVNNGGKTPPREKSRAAEMAKNVAKKQVKAVVNKSRKAKSSDEKCFTPRCHNKRARGFILCAPCGRDKAAVKFAKSENGGNLRSVEWDDE